MFQVIERYAGAGAAEEHANNSPTAAAALNLLIRRTKAPSRASGTTVAANRATLRSWASESNRGETGSARPLDPPDPTDGFRCVGVSTPAGADRRGGPATDGSGARRSRPRGPRGTR